MVIKTGKRPIKEEIEMRDRKRIRPDEPCDKLANRKSKFIEQLSVVDKRIDHLNDCLLDLMGHPAGGLAKDSPAERKCSLGNDANLMSETDKLVEKLDRCKHDLIEAVDRQKGPSKETNEIRDSTDADSISSLKLVFEDDYKQLLSGWPKMELKTERQTPQEDEPCKPASTSVEAPNSDRSAKSDSKEEPPSNRTCVNKTGQPKLDRTDSDEKQFRKVIKKENKEVHPASRPVLAETVSSALQPKNVNKSSVKPDPTAALTGYPSSKEKPAATDFKTATARPKSTPSANSTPGKKKIIILVGGSLLKEKKATVSGESESASKQSKQLVQKQMNYINSIGRSFLK